MRAWYIIGTCTCILYGLQSCISLLTSYPARCSVTKQFMTTTRMLDKKNIDIHVYDNPDTYACMYHCMFVHDIY